MSLAPPTSEKPRTQPKVEYFTADQFTLQFRYNPSHVRKIRSLKNRRWNNDAKRWEIHVSHLGDIIRIFRIDPATLDKKVLRLFQIHQIRHSCTRLRVGNAMTRLEGTELPLEKLDQATSYSVPGHQYMPRFTEGKWDGREHLLDRKNCAVPSGLIGRVRIALEELGTAYEVMEPGLPEFEPTGAKAPSEALPPYQQNCLKSALKARRGVLELATGQGKAPIAAYLMHELQLPAVYFVRTQRDLAFVRAYLEEQLGIPVGQVGAKRVDIRPVTVAMVQTCARAFDISCGLDAEDCTLEADATPLTKGKSALVEYLKSVNMFFLDECHVLPAECCYHLAMKLTGALYRIGLCSTPHRTDRLDMLLEAALGPKIARVGASTLIERGLLVPPRITFHAIPSTTRRLNVPEFQVVYNEGIVTNSVRNKIIAQKAKSFAAKKLRTVVLVSSERHGEILRDLLPEVPLVRPCDSDESVESLRRKFATGRPRLIIVTTAMAHMLDIAEIEALVLACGGRCETRVLQFVSRTLRPMAGKSEVFVVDFLDQAPGLKEIAQRRLQIYQSEPKFDIRSDGRKGA